MLPLLSSKSGAPLLSEHLRPSRSTSSPRAKYSGWNLFAGSCLALSLLSLAYVLHEVMTGSWGSQLEQLQQHIRTSGNSKQSDVLVMYIFSNTDPQYLNNLKYFVREGVHAGDGCEYLFVVNKSPEEEVRTYYAVYTKPHGPCNITGFVVPAGFLELCRVHLQSWLCRSCPFCANAKSARAESSRCRRCAVDMILRSIDLCLHASACELRSVQAI